MDTTALVESISNYPLLVDVLLFDDGATAYQMLYNNFNAIRELETRSDGLYELTQFINTNNAISDDYVRKTALEVIALSANFPSTASNDQDSLNTSLINYTDAYNLYPDLNPTVVLSLRSIIPTPTTPSGDEITVSWTYDRTPELTQAQKNAVEEQVLMVYNLYPAGDATVKYNCHSYAWHSQSINTNKYWINYPDDYLSDPLVLLTFAPIVGDRIVYKRSINDRFQHSGIIISNNGTLLIKSKWGAWGLYNHTVGNCPAEYGTYVYYYTII